jgi:hypothetical protein
VSARQDGSAFSAGRSIFVLISIMSPRHTCALRATPQTARTMVSLHPPFTMPREMCIVAARIITVAYKELYMTMPRDWEHALLTVIHFASSLHDYKYNENDAKIKHMSLQGPYTILISTFKSMLGLNTGLLFYSSMFRRIWRHLHCSSVW